MEFEFDKPIPLFRLADVSSTEAFFKSMSLLVIICKSFSSSLIPSLSEKEDDREEMELRREGLGGPGRSLTRSLGGAGLMISVCVCGGE